MKTFLKVLLNLIMTAEEFILNSKQLYVQKQPHAARVFHDTSIKVKNLNCPTLAGLGPYYLLKLVRLLQRKEPFTENAELQQEQLKLLTDDK